MSSSTASPADDATPPSSSPAAVQPLAPALTPPEQYTVITRGVTFQLSRSQIEYDSPNYFTAAFLDHDFAEAASKVVYLDRNPQWFALIVEHLSGYEITPLQPQGLPPCMSPELARRNLFTDAEYFGLDKLQKNLGRRSMRRILSGASSELKEYIIFCNFSPAAAEPLAQLLHDADLREVWVVRAAYKLGIITLEFLMDRVQLSPGWAVALMAYQTDNKWSSWDARRTAHR